MMEEFGEALLYTLMGLGFITCIMSMIGMVTEM